MKKFERFSLVVNFLRVLNGADYSLDQKVRVFGLDGCG